MRIGPKYKICRRLGSDVFEKCQTQKYQLNEDKRSKGRGRRRKPRSDYGKQLLEKQKTRFTYGIAERQFSKYVREAISQNKLKPPQALRLFLESRLDNIVYKMGLAPTRRAARQAVSHGHINVNGKRVKIPSYRVMDGDVVSVRDRSKEKGTFQETEEDKSANALPVWISYDPKKQEGKVKSLPETDSAGDVNLDLTSVIEFYSR